METPQDTNKSINCKGKTINLDQAIIMGILNLTPDSFFDGGKYTNEQSIIEQVKQLLNDGASIIDIGGQSTRPGAKVVSSEEELQRVLPVVQLLKSHFNNIVISIDTYYSNVAKKCIEAGAAIINDVSGGSIDNELFKTVGTLNVPYILMHIKGTPQDMQQNPIYHNVVEEVKSYFKEKISQLKANGVTNIILDPGFGFGKTVEHNYELLQNLEEFNTFELPILIGISRKSMITKVLNNTPEEALNGTTALNTIALQKGANILRVHDVKEAKECVDLVNRLKIQA